MNCDHGIRLDTWCADCEEGFVFRDEVIERRRSGLIAAGCVLLLAVMLILAFAAGRAS